MLLIGEEAETEEGEFSTIKPALQQMLKDLLLTGNTERVYKLEPKTIK